MKANVVITREYLPTHTLGIVSCYNEYGNGFSCKSIELAWQNNKKNVSCIPVDNYFCAWTKSSKFSKKKGSPVYTYEVRNVPNRSGIRIHSATYVRHLQGCIAFGSSFRDIDKDGILDLTDTVETIQYFNDFMDGADFILTIKEK